VRKKLLDGELAVVAVNGLERAEDAGLFFKGDDILYERILSASSLSLLLYSGLYYGCKLDSICGGVLSKSSNGSGFSPNAMNVFFILNL